MRILRAIVHPQPLLMPAGQAELPERGGAVPGDKNSSVPTAVSMQRSRLIIRLLFIAPAITIQRLPLPARFPGSCQAATSGGYPISLCGYIFLSKGKRAWRAGFTAIDSDRRKPGMSRA